MAYSGYTESRKRANKKYLDKQAEIRIRMLPEEKKEIERMALLEGKSVNQYIKDKLFDK